MTTKARVEILVAPGCSSRQQTRELLENAISTKGTDANIEEIVVESTAQVLQYKFLGSPSVRVNGIDVEPAARQRTKYGLG